MIINEDNRNQLINGSKNGPEKGKQRYKRRLKSRVASSVREFNSIDMNKLFKDDILTVNIKVHGETDDYIVSISFGGLCRILQDEIERNGSEKLELRDIIRAFLIAFNRDDVFIRCDCPDFQYRFGFWSSKKNIIVGDPETRPSDITNPNDSLGTACKHILLVLSNTTWAIKVCSVIRNYALYIEKHYPKLYADIIYPAIFGKEYEEPVQLSVEDTDELSSDEETVDIANKERVQDTRFKKGNVQGVRFSKKDDSIQDQISIEDTEEEEEETDSEDETV